MHSHGDRVALRQRATADLSKLQAASIALKAKAKQCAQILREYEQEYDECIKVSPKRALSCGMHVNSYVFVCIDFWQRCRAQGCCTGACVPHK